MAQEQETAPATRAPTGRYLPGQSGNTAGRPRRDPALPGLSRRLRADAITALNAVQAAWYLTPAQRHRVAFALAQSGEAPRLPATGTHSPEPLPPSVSVRRPARSPAGRFKPGSSGNPRGRPRSGACPSTRSLAAADRRLALDAIEMLHFTPGADDLKRRCAASNLAMLGCFLRRRRPVDCCLGHWLGWVPRTEKC